MFITCFVKPIGAEAVGVIWPIFAGMLALAVEPDRADRHLSGLFGDEVEMTSFEPARLIVAGCEN
jgi:hypothetical protein